MIWIHYYTPINKFSLLEKSKCWLPCKSRRNESQMIKFQTINAHTGGLRAQNCSNFSTKRDFAKSDSLSVFSENSCCFLREFSTCVSPLAKRGMIGTELSDATPPKNWSPTNVGKTQLDGRDVPSVKHTDASKTNKLAAHQPLHITTIILQVALFGRSRIASWMPSITIIHPRPSSARHQRRQPIDGFICETVSRFLGGKWWQRRKHRAAAEEEDFQAFFNGFRAPIFVVS